MRSKPTVYILVLLTCLFLNIFYYRQQLIEHWMRWQIRNEHIVISLSTTPYRINSLQPTLDSLYAQNVDIDAIYLNVPYVFKRDNIQYEIPEYLINDKRITIIRAEDYGPGTKLLGLLQNVTLPADTIIITVDDDVVYPVNLVLNLAYKAKQHPDRAFGIIGANPDPTAEIGLSKIKNADAQVSLLQGYAGVAYRRSFFDEQIFAINDFPQECKNSDDIFLSFFLAMHDIPRQVVGNKYICPCDIKWETSTGTDTNALHNLHPSPAEKHQACLNYLHQQFPRVVF